MGMSFMKRSSWTQPGTKVMAPNPDPDRFSVITCAEVGNYLIAVVQYVGCTTFEGKKILVFKDKKASWIRGLPRLDPHFSNHPDSPVARFVATKEGTAMAVAFCEAMIK